MTDIFISYARSTAREAQVISDTLRALGYSVWRDDELPAHRAYADVIEERLQAAKAVLVIWSAEAVKSQWVQSEADTARIERKLVQLTVDDARLPRPFDRIQCADLAGWTGDLDAPGWRKIAASVADLIGGGAHPRETASAAPAPLRQRSICVLPFANMSGDPEQEYFSDGISEDIITDLSKVSALFVVARNTAFTFKGRSVDVPEIAARLKVSHVLEGSVRKAGGRVRITAQLIDGATGGHVWAERYDRDLTDIFALQDEISQAIVAALKLKLLPEEKRAIERRDTANLDAYSLYLMARSYYLGGRNQGARRAEAMIRLCKRAVEIDPDYARAWALMAAAQLVLHYTYSQGDDGLAAAETALKLNPGLAEAHAVKARYLSDRGLREEASAELDTALQLDPQSYEANLSAGHHSYREGRFEDACLYFGKAADLAEHDFDSVAMLTSASAATGNTDAMREAARRTLALAERALAQDGGNVVASSYGAYALAALGDRERAKDWIDRALLIDPDNLNMRYNMACAVSVYLKDTELALSILAPFFAATTSHFLAHAKVDPDLDAVRTDPRFAALVDDAEKRLASLPA